MCYNIDEKPTADMVEIRRPFVSSKDELAFSRTPVSPGYVERVYSEGQEDIGRVFARIEVCCELPVVRWSSGTGSSSLQCPPSNTFQPVNRFYC